MHIDIRSGGARLQRAHALNLAERFRTAFGRLSSRIVRIVVRLRDASRPGGAGRECTVEVHLSNGEVAMVQERQRKLGALFRRVTERALRVAAAAIGRQPKQQPRLRMQPRPEERRA